MWRYIFMAVSVAGAATQYPLLFQQKADEITASRQEQRLEQQQMALRQSSDEGEDTKRNPLAGRVAEINRDRSGHYVARVKMNGRSTEVLVDTGATLVAINESTARRLGIRLTPADFKYTVRTANGTTKAAAAMIDEIQIGRVIVKNVEASVSKDGSLNVVLLGMSFLNKLKKFEIESDKLILRQ
ncbi:MAG: TIGR02281 family clan AA aspartic protease [Nitratireductor sp.]|nr:TIGR02281 family clan AA aspartic protease [Nitratireductor sp.]